jgi:GT2 family glycosyltransferase
VVDNAPRGAATAQAVRAFPGVRYMAEDRPGLSHARNAGIEAAKGEIIAFTDDDVELPPDWIARLAAPFADPGVGCVTGLVLPADLSGEAACLFEFAIGGFGHLLHRRRFDRSYLRSDWWRPPDVWKIGAGANMAMRRAVFAEVGLFDPRLGAGAAGCSEDSEFWFRLLHAGHVCLYDPAAVVFHHHRGDRPALVRQLRAYARGHVVALFVQFSQDRQPAHLIRAFALMPWYYLKLALRALRDRDRDLLAIVRPQILGCLEGPFHALSWLRRAGPPRLDLHPAPQPSGERP